MKPNATTAPNQAAAPAASRPLLLALPALLLLIRGPSGVGRARLIK
jgi:hypothetical protein